MNEQADSGPDSCVSLDVCLHDFGVAEDFLIVISSQCWAAQKHGDATNDGSADFFDQAGDVGNVLTIHHTWTGQTANTMPWPGVFTFNA